MDKMNDFTKKELEELSFWLTRLAMMENKLNELKLIHEKIQSMIEKMNKSDEPENIEVLPTVPVGYVWKIDIEGNLSAQPESKHDENQKITMIENWS